MSDSSKAWKNVFCYKKGWTLTWASIKKENKVVIWLKVLLINVMDTLKLKVPPRDIYQRWFFINKKAFKDMLPLQSNVWILFFDMKS